MILATSRMSAASKFRLASSAPGGPWGFGGMMFTNWSFPANVFASGRGDGGGARIRARPARDRGTAEAGSARAGGGGLAGLGPRGRPGGGAEGPCRRGGGCRRRGRRNCGALLDRERKGFLVPTLAHRDLVVLHRRQGDPIQLLALLQTVD